MMNTQKPFDPLIPYTDIPPTDEYKCFQMFNVRVHGVEEALFNMRMPKESWHRYDSEWVIVDSWNENDNVIKLDDGRAYVFKIGKNDRKLADALVAGGPEHRKFLRECTLHFTCKTSIYHTAEMDTYKIGSTRNSTSFMHTGTKDAFVIEDFEIRDPLERKLVKCYIENEPTKKYQNWQDIKTAFIDEDNPKELAAWYGAQAYVKVIETLNHLRDIYNKTNDPDIFIMIRELVPSGVFIVFGCSLTFETARNMYEQRVTHPHRLPHWRVEFAEALKKVPHADIMLKGLI